MQGRSDCLGGVRASFQDGTHQLLQQTMCDSRLFGKRDLSGARNFVMSWSRSLPTRNPVGKTGKAYCDPLSEKVTATLGEIALSQ
jgi:hypothetical protein